MRRIVLLATLLIAFPAAAEAQSTPPPAATIQPAPNGTPARGGLLQRLRNMPTEAPKFVRAMAAFYLRQIEYAKLATEKASDPAVRRFAQQTSEDYGKASAALAAKAQALPRVKLRTELPARQKAALEKQRTTPDAQFDRRYVRQQARAHERAIAIAHNYVEKGDNADLQAWARDALPSLQAHLKIAQGMPGFLPRQRKAK